MSRDNEAIIAAIAETNVYLREKAIELIKAGASMDMLCQFCGQAASINSIVESMDESSPNCFRTGLLRVAPGEINSAQFSTAELISEHPVYTFLRDFNAMVKQAADDARESEAKAQEEAMRSRNEIMNQVIEMRSNNEESPGRAEGDYREDSGEQNA